jgi:hypothetical protein
MLESQTPDRARSPTGRNRESAANESQDGNSSEKSLLRGLA